MAIGGAGGRTKLMFWKTEWRERKGIAFDDIV